MNDDAVCDEVIDEGSPTTIPEPALYWTACFLVSKCFGSEAEGGWWYDQGELVTNPVCLPISILCFAHKRVVRRERQKSGLFARSRY